MIKLYFLEWTSWCLVPTETNVIDLVWYIRNCENNMHAFHNFLHQVKRSFSLQFAMFHLSVVLYQNQIQLISYFNLFKFSLNSLRYLCISVFWCKVLICAKIWKEQFKKGCKRISILSSIY